MNKNIPSKDELIKLYNLGCSMKKISEQLDMSVGKIHKYFVIYNIKPRKKLTCEAIEKIRQANLGNQNMLGKKLSEETKNKIRLSKLGKYCKNTQYGGHKKQRTDGYVSIYCPKHPNASKDGYVMEHILIMEEFIGRLLKEDEVVHHKNKKRNDNSIENLELMTFKEHARMHLKERYQEGGDLYQYDNFNR